MFATAIGGVTGWYGVAARAPGFAIRCVAPLADDGFLLLSQVREVAAAAREVRLTLGRGRWLAHRWGRPPLASRPGGATLAASFMPTADTDAAWRTLTHKMGASFCSALVELAAPTHWHSPLRSPFPQRQLGPGSVHRTGALLSYPVLCMLIPAAALDLHRRTQPSLG